MDYPIQTPLQLSSHLRAFRHGKGMNQADLGVRLGVGQSRVTRIEQDPSAISVAQLLAMLNALGVQMVLRGPEENHTDAQPPALGQRFVPDEPW